MRSFDREALGGSAPDVAPLLLGALLVSDVGRRRAVGRIVEVEAYTEDDPASHTYRGRTPRNAPMFGPAGFLYVYLSYGIHRCVNVVTGPDGRGEAVLIRAVEIEAGLAVVESRRGGRARRELTDGPGKLCQALAIGAEHDGLDALDARSEVRLLVDRPTPPGAVLVGPRVGITKGVDTPWRFRLDGRPPSARASAS